MICFAREVKDPPTSYCYCQCLFALQIFLIAHLNNWVKAPKRRVKVWRTHQVCKLEVTAHVFEGILPKGPYLPCVSMTGRALLAGYPCILEMQWSLIVLFHKSQCALRYLDLMSKIQNTSSQCSLATWLTVMANEQNDDWPAPVSLVIVQPVIGWLKDGVARHWSHIVHRPRPMTICHCQI